MGIARKMIKWVDNIMDNSYGDHNHPRAMLKACGAGVIEGIVDGMILSYLVIVAGDICKLASKKK